MRKGQKLEVSDTFSQPVSIIRDLPTGLVFPINNIPLTALESNILRDVEYYRWLTSQPAL